MMSIERILCPLTLPPEKDEALRYGISLALAFNADLLLCHCARAPALLTSAAAATAANGKTHAQLRKLMAESLAPFVGRARLRFEIIVVDGGNDVGEEIVNTARERHVDLIVMRSKRSRVAALLGSVAEQVSRTASCPVLVIHEDGESKTDYHRRVRFSRILVSHDFSSSAELALSYALSLAEKFRAELHVLHVLPEPEEDEPEIAWNHISLITAYQRAVEHLQQSVPEEFCKCCRVIHVVRWGKPYREALAYAAEQNVDLVCMGALGRDYGLQALFGSNVDRVLRQAPCPTLIARPLQTATPRMVSSRVITPGLRKTLSSWVLTPS